MLRRRDFIKGVGMGLAGASLLRADQPPPPVNFRLAGKSVLVQSDFTYLGSFKMPTSAGGYSTGSYSRGLTHRYLDGALRFFTTVTQAGGVIPRVYEVNYPGYGALPGGAPTASVLTFWGDIYGDKRVADDAHPDGTKWTYGLFWDSVDSRLYWNYGYDYDDVGSNPCFGYSTLNDGTGVATAVAAYRMGNANKMYRFGITPIPAYFANGYCGGKRLGIGFGQYCSVMAGTISIGPALAAIAPPSGAHLSQIPAPVPLINFPLGSALPARRTDGYTDQLSYHDPVGGVGYWQWMDFLYQSAYWIDTPTKHGFVFSTCMCMGTVSYHDSDIHATGGIEHWMFVIDPQQFAGVAQGAKNPYDVPMASYWKTDHPGYSYPFGVPAAGGWYKTAQGMTFDATNNRLYILVPETLAPTSYNPTVEVWQVA